MLLYYPVVGFEHNSDNYLNFRSSKSFASIHSTNTYLFKPTIEALEKQCEICAKSTIKTPFSDDSIINFKQVNVSWITTF